MSNRLKAIRGGAGEKEMSENSEPDINFEALLAEHTSIRGCFAAAIEEKEMLRNLNEETGVPDTADATGLDLEITTLLSTLDHLEKAILRYDTDLPNDVAAKLELLALLLEDGVEVCPQTVSNLAKQSATAIASLVQGAGPILRD